MAAKSLGLLLLPMQCLDQTLRCFGQGISGGKEAHRLAPVSILGEQQLMAFSTTDCTENYMHLPYIIIE
jgi:hypothetical protein